MITAPLKLPLYGGLPAPGISSLSIVTTISRRKHPWQTQKKAEPFKPCLCVGVEICFVEEALIYLFKVFLFGSTLGTDPIIR